MSDTLFGGLRASFDKVLPSRFRSDGAVVPVLRLYGAIGMGFPASQSLTLAGLAGQIEAAFKTKRAKAVALQIRSPGGSPVQSHLIFKRIRDLSAEKKLPVFAFIEDVGASGGYMLACAADEIYADPSSVVGSIGVVSAGFGLTGLIEKLGVERRVYTAGTSKAMLDPFQPEKKEDIARLKELQGDIHEMFIDLVKSRRDGKLRGDESDLFSGAFWTGTRAKALGLVDDLGDLRSVMRARFGKEVELKVVAPPGRRGLLKFLPAGLSATPSSLVDPAALIAAAEERAMWSRYGL
jgi:signal peptide peptidase SppA